MDSRPLHSWLIQYAWMAFSLRAQILREVAYNQDVRILTSANQVTMKRIITLSAVMSVLASLPSCICAARVDNAPVKSLDLTRYLGTCGRLPRQISLDSVPHPGRNGFEA